MQAAIHQTQPNHATRDRDEIKRDAFQEARATTKFAISVAPFTSLDVVRDGKALTLRAGEEVRLTDFMGDQTVATKLWRLEEADAVIVISEEEQARRATSATARYIVHQGGSVVTKRGIVVDGCEVTAKDFERGQLDLDDLVRRGAVVDRQPSPPPKAA